MRNSIALIDKARSLCVPSTDYQLAKKLGISHATLSRCRHRNGTLDNEAATKLADLLQQDRYEVIAIMEAERARTPEKKAFWESQLPRLLPVVALLGITTGVTCITEQVVRPVDTVYIMRIRRWLRALGQTACGLGRCAT